jgi:putative transposase
MRTAGIVGLTVGGSVAPTRQHKRARPTPDVLERDFTATGLDRRWVADITYVPTWLGFWLMEEARDAKSWSVHLRAVRRIPTSARGLGTHRWD